MKTKTSTKKLSPQARSWATRRKLNPSKWGTPRQRARAAKAA